MTVVNKKARLTGDGTVTTTEKKTSTTTIYPITKATEDGHSKGFFSKLFGRTKEKPDKNGNIPYYAGS